MKCPSVILISFSDLTDFVRRDSMRHRRINNALSLMETQTEMQLSNVESTDTSDDSAALLSLLERSRVTWQCPILFSPAKSRHFEELVPLLILESNPTTPSSRVNVQLDDNPTKIQFICLVSICDCFLKNHFGHFLKFIGLGNNVQIKLSDSYRIIFDHFQSFSLFFGGLEMT